MMTRIFLMTIRSFLSGVLLVAFLFNLNTSASAQGSAGYALSLNGVTGTYAQVNNNVPFNTNFTVEAWVYVRSYNSWSRVIDFANGPNDDNVYLALTSGSSGDATAGVFTNTGTPTLSATNVIPIDQWAHLALTLSGTNGTIYLNGNIAGSGPLNIPPNLVRTNNYIGRSNYSGDGYANTAYSDIRIWSVARTQGQIQADMNQRLSGDETGLVAYWPCTQTSGTTLTNLSGSGNLYNATLLGNAGWTNSGPPIFTQCAVGTTNLFEGPATGEDTVTLGVTPLNLPWIATANAPWLTAVDSSGNGSANVLFSFQANPGPTRTGTLTLATAITNFTITITQAGSNYIAAPCPLTELASAPDVWDVAVDTAGNVYGLELANGLVTEWNRTNNMQTTAVDGLLVAFSMAFDNAGNLFIANDGDGSIFEWTPGTGESPVYINIPDVSSPFGITVDRNESVYFSSANSSIKKWTPANDGLTVLESSPTEPFGPQQLAMDAAGNLYTYATEASYSEFGIVEWSANTGQETAVYTQSNQISCVAVDGSGNLYASVYAPSTSIYTLYELVAASGAFTALASADYPTGIKFDPAGNLYVADNGAADIAELPRAFIDPTSHVEGPAAGIDTLSPVIPATESLLPPFAPASDSPWLWVTNASGGVVTFAFTSTTTNRTGHITLLGQSIAITQNAPPGPPALFGAALSSPGTFQFSITNAGSATSLTVLETTNLNLPLTDWTVAGTAVNVSPRVFQFIDSQATNTARFYTVRSN